MVVADCRPASRVTDEAAEKFAATAAACRMLNWVYLLLVEPDSPARCANLRWLAGYRHPRFAEPAVELALHDALVQPCSLLGAAHTAGDPIRTLPVLYHLLWRGELTCDLAHPLTDRTIIRTAAPGEVVGITHKGVKS